MKLLSFAVRLVENLVIREFKRSEFHYLNAYASAPKSSGVYSLYASRKPGDRLTVIYVGKVCSKDGLQRRLLEHSLRMTKAAHFGVLCRWLPIESEWVANALEVTLIKTYNPILNGSGFGTRTPRSVDGKSEWEKLL